MLTNESISTTRASGNGNPTLSAIIPTAVPRNVSCLNSIQHSLQNGTNYYNETIFIQEKVIFAQIFYGFYSVAAICFAITVFLYSVTWRRQTLNGRTILAFSVSQVCSYLLWCVSLGTWIFQTEIPCDTGNGKEIQVRPVLIGTSFCNFVGALGFVSGFSAFTWMTVLNFHICTTIRSTDPKAADSKCSRRFFIYNVFGFGVPIIITLVSVVLEHQIGYFDDQHTREEHGYDPCGVDKYYTTYMVRVIYSVVLLLKLIFAFFVFKTLWEYKKRTKERIKNNVSHPKNNNIKKEVSMWAKLVVLNDLSWIFEIIWSLKSATTSSYTWYRVIQNSIYILQAFFLFRLFVFTREMRVFLSLEYPLCKRYFQWFDGSINRNKRRGKDSSKVLDSNGGETHSETAESRLSKSHPKVGSSSQGNISNGSEFSSIELVS